MAPTRNRSMPSIVAAVGGFTFVAFGVWAMASPATFFENLASFDPYNAHFLQDIGAFQIGLGATLVLAALFTSDALAAGLLGVGLGASMHVVSHLVGASDGGNPSVDIPALSVLGVALFATGLLRLRSVRAGRAS